MDLTRLSRSQADLPKLIDRLVHRGVRVIGVQDGYDSARKGHKLQAGLTGIIGEAFREMVAEKTYSALESRAQAKRPTGGRAFGYRSEPVIVDGEVSHTRLRVEETEAEVVRRIFQMYADGASARRIAEILNLEDVPSPRGLVEAHDAASWWLGTVCDQRGPNSRHRHPEQRALHRARRLEPQPMGEGP